MMVNDVESDVHALNPELRPAIVQLQLICESTIEYAAFLDITANVDVHSKISDSFSGHVISGQISGTAHLCIMSICRFWDQDTPLKLAKEIRTFAAQLEKIRRKHHQDWPDSALQLGSLESEIDHTIQLAQEFLRSTEFGHIRTFRTEHIAHNQNGASRDRKKYLREDVVPVTKIGELVNASRLTFNFLDRLVSHWKFHINDNEGAFEIRKSYARMYWDALPIFGETENVDLLSEGTQI